MQQELQIQKNLSPVSSVEELQISMMSLEDLLTTVGPM